MELYHGAIVFSKSNEELAEYKDAYLAVQDGVIEGIFETFPQKFAGVKVIELAKDEVLIPAFSDLHVHAPQYPNRGIAMDELLSDWLNDYTFPLEGKYSDLEFAKAVYSEFVDDMIAHGTMHAVVFGTIHSEATGFLLERFENKGIQSFVGKVNMDADSPAYLLETTADSLKRTQEFLEKYISNKFAKPILTPRFAPTCSRELLFGLGKLAKRYGVGVQTHVVESIWEAQEAKRRFSDCSCDTEIYEKAGLLDGGPVVAAHFIYPSADDVRILKAHGGYAVQCPDATISVIAGIMQTGKLSDAGVNLALGTDLSAGHSLGVYSQVARSVQLSKIKSLYEPENHAITFARAFAMATKEGGKLFGNVGSFEKGYKFDALVIGGVTNDFENLSPSQIVERFCYLGETKRIHERFLNGRKIG